MSGGGRVVVQSMTNTDTADAKATAQQIYQLHQAGSELVRITVNNEESAAAVPEIIDRLRAAHCEVPVIGDFHYNGHRLLQDYPKCAELLAKYRINPGNVGFGKKWDQQFESIIQVAKDLHKPVRIGGNWGSSFSSCTTLCRALSPLLPEIPTQTRRRPCRRFSSLASRRGHASS